MTKIGIAEYDFDNDDLEDNKAESMNKKDSIKSSNTSEDER